jgi:DNA-binding CsgD family transcriptional regulator
MRSATGATPVSYIRGMDPAPPRPGPEGALDLDREEAMGTRRLVGLACAAAALVVGLAALDLVIEGEGFDPADFAFELLDRAITVGVMAAVAWITFGLRELRTEQAALRADVARAVALGEDWRAASRAALDDLGAAIQRQFDAWALTRAEADIAGLMLKGVPLRDIALLRHTSESTIRQQAQAIYRKSGLSGRAEFAAYFLESLFEDRAAQ